MVSLQVNNLIKIIIVVLVVGIVVAGVSFFVKDYVISFFKNLVGGGEVPALFLSLL